MLFCKPSPRKGIIYGQPGQVSFRSLDLKKDMALIHHWGNNGYANFLQPDDQQENLLKTYRAVLTNPESHSFIGLSDDIRICQVDLYRVHSCELGKHIRIHYDDCVLDLFMAPLPEMQHLGKNVMQSFLGYYFSFPEAECMYAGPEIHNHNACRLLEKSGFIFQQNIMLPSKAASLYLMTRKLYGAYFGD